MGITLVRKTEHLNRERLLFHHILNTARTHLQVSWRTLSRDDRPASKSPFIADLLGLFPENTDQVLGPPPRPAVVAPAAGAIASLRDMRNHLLARAATGRTEAFAPFEPELAFCRALAAFEAQRFKASPFDDADGALTDTECVAAVATRFGPHHQFSVDQLETYAQCPFMFFLNRILAVDDVEIPVSEFDARVRGTLMHRILQRFHERYRGVPDPRYPL